MLFSAIASGILSLSFVSSAKSCVDPSELFKKVSPSVVYVAVRIEKDGQQGKGHGSGAVIDSLGSVITSTHVVDDAKEIVIVDDEGNVYPYKVKKMGDKDSVTSLIPAEVGKFPVSHTPLSAPFLSFGESLHNVGYPYQYNKKMFNGNLAGVESVNGMPVLITNMATYPGLSGSPVFDCEGSIVGFVLAHDVRSNSLGWANVYTDAKEVL